MSFPLGFFYGEIERERERIVEYFLWEILNHERVFRKRENFSNFFQTSLFNFLSQRIYNVLLNLSIFLSFSLSPNILRE
jgi:hypothetical protein